VESFSELDTDPDLQLMECCGSLRIVTQEEELGIHKPTAGRRSVQSPASIGAKAQCKFDTSSSIANERKIIAASRLTWQVFRVAYRMTKRPLVIVGLLLLFGYCSVGFS